MYVVTAETIFDSVENPSPKLLNEREKKLFFFFNKNLINLMVDMTYYSLISLIFVTKKSNAIS